MADEYPITPAVKAKLVARLTSGTLVHRDIHRVTGWDIKLPYGKVVDAIGAEFGYRLQRDALGQLPDDPNHKQRKLFRFEAVSAQPVRMTDFCTLGEIASRASMLQIVCSRCERRGRYRLDTLIARHGADAGVRVIVPELIADCRRCGGSGATCCFPSY